MMSLLHRPETGKEFKAEERGKPVGMVHVDYTAPGGLRRLHMIFPEEAEKLKKTPFAIIQVSPLALIPLWKDMANHTPAVC